MVQSYSPALFAARVLLSALFIISGMQKLLAYSEAAQMLAAGGVSSVLLPVIILVELGGGLMILVGYQTRITAMVLALFIIAMGFFFQYRISAIMLDFMKNLAIAGGFLALYAAGPGEWSVDDRMHRPTTITRP